MRSTSRCADCWTYLTLLAPPDPASSALGRARVVSLRGVLFSFFYQNIPTFYSYVLLRCTVRTSGHTTAITTNNTHQQRQEYTNAVVAPHGSADRTVCGSCSAYQSGCAAVCGLTIPGGIFEQRCTSIPVCGNISLCNNIATVECSNSQSRERAMCSTANNRIYGIIYLRVSPSTIAALVWTNEVHIDGSP